MDLTKLQRRLSVVESELAAIHNRNRRVESDKAWETVRVRLLSITGITYSVIQKSVAKFLLLDNAIDSRMRIKTTTYSDLRQKPCQFHWHGLLQVAICNHGLSVPRAWL